MKDVKTIPNATHVKVNDDGTTSNGSKFSAVNDEIFYLDYIKYTVKKGHLVVWGYDKRGRKGTANIVSGITYKGNTYEVLEVGDWAFENSSSLTSVNIPDSVTDIGEWVFYMCLSLKSVVIGNGVTGIEHGTFYNCSSLTSFDIPDSVTSIRKGAFGYCKSLTSIVIPESVTSIGEDAFSGSALTSIVIPKSITSIEDYAFALCSALTSIVIPSSVTSIGEGAFEDCSALTSIDIPSSVTSIGLGAFANCSALTTVICRAEKMPKLRNGAFSGVPQSKATLYVPASALEAYKAAELWKDFGKILPIEEQ